jgi:hypothetical protein
VAEGTAFRLDTIDVALELGWNVESTSGGEDFTKDGVTITVEYSADDDIGSIAKRGANSEYELIGQSSLAKHDVLRTWLTGRMPTSTEGPKRFQRRVSRAPKLRWSRESWLYKPTGEVVDHSDPRVPRTVDASKKQSKIWYRMGSQADAEDGYYRREMDVDTATATEPMYTAVWHPRNGAAELLVRGNGSQAYLACVRHHQAKYDG